MTDLLDILEQVERNAAPDWKAEAEQVIADLAARYEHFTTDYVWEHMTTATHEPRAMGALMKRMASRGVIAATADWSISKRPECHGRPLRVWRSTWAS